MSSYRNTVEQLNEQAEARMSCRWCHTSTPATQLGNYGSRCFRCYEAFCAEPSPSLGYDRNKGLKDWALSLKAREESGESLSGAQRAMWRSAVGP